MFDFTMRENSLQGLALIQAHNLLRNEGISEPSFDIVIYYYYVCL